MTLRQQDHTRDAAAFSEVVEMFAQNGGARGPRGVDAGLANMVEIAKARRAVKVNQEMAPGVGDLLSRGDVRHRMQSPAAKLRGLVSVGRIVRAAKLVGGADRP